MTMAGSFWQLVLATALLSAIRGHGQDPTAYDVISGQEMTHRSPNLHFVQPSDLGDILYHNCALLAVPPYDVDVQTLLADLGRLFQNDERVLVGQLINIDNSSQLWKVGMTSPKNQGLLAFYAKESRDRTCLLTPKRKQFSAEVYTGQLQLEALVQFINEKCGVFRTVRGDLNSAGLFHQRILKNLYRPAKPVNRCKRIRMPGKSEFHQEYLLRSRPVVIENAVTNWPALRKWTTEFLHKELGSKEVHLKLTPDGVFEGVENAALWSDYHKDWMPEAVRSQLDYPDLVVVRPATAEMRFSSFLDFISSGNRTYSAYLEYSSIPQYMPTLVADIAELPCIAGDLELRHLNMWLSDGNTLGKLHFDPYDNFLCQVSGEKHLTLFDPHHNENLYEAHIPEAILSFDPAKGNFHRRALLESTSMVMSPVDIQYPDWERFPRFGEARRLECTLRPGDALFMPAFWWHEVQSHPDRTVQRNLAVNFWYEPVFTKEFPCADCRLEFNMFYRHMLEQYH